MANFVDSPVKVMIPAPVGEGKAITLNDLPPEAWRIIRGGAGEGDTARLFRVVPWLYRGVHLRAQAVSKMPFTLYQGEDVYETSRDYQNRLGFLANIKRLLYLYEASLVMEGAAYIIKNKGAYTRKVKELQYLRPDTVRPKFEDGILVRFERAVQGESQPRSILPKEMVYTFLPDLYVETGAGSPPGRAALAASGVLESVDGFASAFFSNGAIKATILSVDPSVHHDQEEMDRLKSWWERVVSGKKGSWKAHVVSSKVEPKIIGEGLDSLSNTSLTTEKREDIATALGVPQSLLFSNAANYATAQQDDLHFYDKTVVPECELIEADWNEHLFAPLGFRLKFTPDGLDVFQADENNRSVAYKNYTEAGIRPSVVAQMLGIDLPEGVEFADLDRDLEAGQEREERLLEAEIAKRNQPAQAQQVQPGHNPANQTGAQAGEEEEQVGEELARWQKKALRQVKAGKPVPEFESDVIPSTLAAAISAQLAVAANAEDIKAVFDAASNWRGYP